jgi:hypothetical protein
VGAAEGHWRESATSSLFLRCREGNCVKELVAGPLSAAQPNASSARRRLAQQRSAAPFAGANCAAGNTGPLCAVCADGYTMQSGVCAPCDPADAWAAWPRRSRAGLLVGMVVVGLALLALLFFQPIVPALERGVQAALKRASAAAHCAKERFCSCCCGRQSSNALAPSDGAGDSAAAPGQPRSEALVAATTSAPAQEDAAPGDAASVHQHHLHAVRVAHQHTQDQAAAHQAAFAVGSAVVLGSMLADGADELDGGSSLGDGAVAEADETMNLLEEMVDMLRKIAKIIVKSARLRPALQRFADAHLPLTQLLPDLQHVSEVAGRPLATCAPCATRAAGCSPLLTCLTLPLLCASCVRRHHGARQRRQPQPGAASQDGCAAAGPQLAVTAQLC